MNKYISRRSKISQTIFIAAEVKLDWYSEYLMICESILVAQTLKFVVKFIGLCIFSSVWVSVNFKPWDKKAALQTEFEEIFTDVCV